MKFGTSVPKFLGRNKDSSRRNFVADRFYYFGILNSPSRRASCGIRRSVCRRPSVGRCPSSVIVILILRRSPWRPSSVVASFGVVSSIVLSRVVRPQIGVRMASCHPSYVVVGVSPSYLLSECLSSVVLHCVVRRRIAGVGSSVILSFGVVSFIVVSSVVVSSTVVSSVVVPSMAFLIVLFIIKL